MHTSQAKGKSKRGMAQNQNCYVKQVLLVSHGCESHFKLNSLKALSTSTIHSHPWKQISLYFKKVLSMGESFTAEKIHMAV